MKEIGQYSGYDVRCPYCGSTSVIPEYLACSCKEGELYPRLCTVCKMTFVMQIVITYALTGKKANCLNGAEHNYKETFARPLRNTQLRCVDCHDEQPLPEGHPYLTQDI